jgi:hypothetical protein
MLKLSKVDLGTGEATSPASPRFEGLFAGLE